MADHNTTLRFPETGFLRGASAGLIRMLESEAAEQTLATGAVLFEQGDTGEDLYAILEGSIEVTVLSPDGRRLALALMRAGSLFGEIALFDPGPRTATATAAEPTRIARVRYSDVLARIRRDPGLAVDMITLAGQRMRWMSLQLNEQVFLPLPTRLARKVLYLTHGAARTDVLSLSQAELAEFVGATREAVSKTLAAWKRAGVIEPARGGLAVRDREALRALAEPDLL